MQPTPGEHGGIPSKTAQSFRNFAAEERSSVKEFYRQNHTHQTFDFVQEKKRQYLGLDRRRMRRLGSARVSRHARRRQRS